MKLPNDLLKAMAVGLALTGSMTSCDLIDAEVEPVMVTCEEPSQERQNGENQTVPDSCPGCGVG